MGRSEPFARETAITTDANPSNWALFIGQINFTLNSSLALFD